MWPQGLRAGKLLEGRTDLAGKLVEIYCHIHKVAGTTDKFGGAVVAGFTEASGLKNLELVAVGAFHALLYVLLNTAQLVRDCLRACIPKIFSYFGGGESGCVHQDKFLMLFR